MQHTVRSKDWELEDLDSSLSFVINYIQLYSIFILALDVPPHIHAYTHNWQFNIYSIKSTYKYIYTHTQVNVYVHITYVYVMCVHDIHVSFLSY